MKGNNIGARGGEILGEALKTNNSLTELHLKGEKYE